MPAIRTQKAGKENALALPAANDASGSSSKGKGGKASEPQYATMHDIVLDGEDEGNVPVYDDCNVIRRKIRALEKTPGFKITHWLKEIGSISSNSYRQFMKQSGASGGAGNILYPAAYVWFEKKRIFEGKKKTPTRLQAEENNVNGFELRTRTHVWVIGRR